MHAVMPEQPRSPAPFFLIVADFDRRIFTVEGPMTDDGPWNSAAGRAREIGRLVQCGPMGPNRQALAAEYQQENRLGAAPPGSILRPRQ